MQLNILVLLCALTLSSLCGVAFIKIFKRKRVGQPILKYVEAHKEKSGTPTMGGLFFIIPSIVIFIIFVGGSGRLSVVSLSVTIAFTLVGFIDDFLKLKLKKNEGLKPYQKIIFQFAISILVGVFAYRSNLTFIYLPFSKNTVDIGVFSIFLIAITLIATTNSVNLTDGLDGLAGSVSLIYLIFMFLLINLQFSVFSIGAETAVEYEKLQLLLCAMIGGVLGFLIFNTNKASVFMGDAGSLGLGGFIGSISIFSANILFIPIIGIMFVLSSISVIMQVVVYKIRKKRIFLMAPLHHHFQLKGYSEAKIGNIYSLITMIMGIICLWGYV